LSRVDDGTFDERVEFLTYPAHALAPFPKERFVEEKECFKRQLFKELGGVDAASRFEKEGAESDFHGATYAAGSAKRTCKGEVFIGSVEELRHEDKPMGPGRWLERMAATS
jgi:hypothetical protein